MLERMDANMNSGQEQIQEKLKRIIEEMMPSNQAKTDVKLKELTERIERKNTSRTTGSGSVPLRAEKKPPGRPNEKLMKPAQQLRKPNASSRPGWTRRDRRGSSGETHQRS